MKTRRRTRARGFSLVEVLVASVITLISATALSQLLISIGLNNATAQFNVLAATKARDELLARTSMTPPPAATPVGAPIDCSGQFSGGMRYVCRVEIFDTGDASSGALNIQVPGSRLIRVSLARLGSTRFHVQEGYALASPVAP